MGAIYVKINNDELYHHGIKGQRWGVRRYQNPDGTLTAEGKAKLSKYKNKELLKAEKRHNREISNREKYVNKYKNKVKENPNKARYKRALDVHKRYLVIEKAEKFMEINAIKTMTFSDMNKEKKAAGKAYVKTILGMTLLPTVTMMTPSPIGVGVAFSPSATKYNMRLDRTKRKS